MKSIKESISLLLILVCALAFSGCKSATKKGDGANIDDEGDKVSTSDEVMGTKEGDLATGVPEDQRLNTKDGVAWGKWSAIHFGYDSASVSQEDRATLEEIAKYAKENPDKKIMVAGHCDERGTLEYNRALGQRRALAAREYLVGLGVSARRLGTISYGEEQPSDSGHNEEAWSKNRRGEFGIVQ
ncbi:MAG: peptidoglycan-associated lipoprotein Pal [Verrucomicrobiae bacterium]|nr:peptidoglycan-associated lipoprotein Pal [Verrucomicrobiae bacterium]